MVIPESSGSWLVLQESCDKLNSSQEKAVSTAAFKAFRKRYRTILTQGGKKLPVVPQRTKGQRGRIAKSDAHNLHERLGRHDDAVLRFLRDPHVSHTNHGGERGLRIAKAKMKVSGCFRTRAFGEACARISRYLQSIAEFGYNPVIAIQIALAGNAVEALKQHYGRIPVDA